MAINNVSTAARNAACDAIVDQFDAGSSNGVIQIYTAAFGTLLATLAFSDPAYGAASSGTAQENTITDDSSADDTGTAAVFRISTTNDGSTPVATVLEGTVGTSGADINFNSVSFVTGDTVSITDFPFTYPAS
jgi:hypothetical protein